MTFNPSGKKDDVSLRLKAQNLKNAQHETKQLVLENNQMEERLKELKLVMSREKEEREAKGGVFWKTGKTGNLGSYAKDVLNKTREKTTKTKRVRILKDEPISVAERSKVPGTMGFLAQKMSNSTGKENKANKVKGPRCGQCEEKTAHVSCMECGEDYCAACFAAFHLRGALRKHRSQPLGVNNVRTPRLISTTSNKDTVISEEPRTDNDVSEIPHKDAGFSEKLRSQQLVSANNNNIVAKMVDKDPVKRISPVGASDKFDSSLLHGDYNEADSAASFQQALLEWRNGGKEGSTTAPPATKPCSPVKTPIVQMDTATTMKAPSQKPLHIVFNSDLSYAEQLLLKRHRRTDVAPLVSNVTSPRTAQPIVNDATEETSPIQVAPVDFGSLFNAVLESDQIRMEGNQQPRTESRLSIVELPVDTRVSKLNLPLTSRYDVEIPDDSETASHMTCDSIRRVEREQSVVYQPDQSPVDETTKAYTVLPSGVQICRGDDTMNIPEVALEELSKPVKKRSSSVKKSRPQSRAQSARSRPSSRQGTSRTSLYGEGVLTKKPSVGLDIVANMDMQANVQQVTDLASFFTAKKQQETERNVATPGDNRPKSAKRVKPSNKLYQMAPRSWHPDSSLGTTISDQQVSNHIEDTQYLGAVAATSPVNQLGTGDHAGNRVQSSPPRVSCSGFSPQPPKTPPRGNQHHRSYRMCQQSGDQCSPRSSALSRSEESTYRSADEINGLGNMSARSGCRSGRISQMIVVEGGDPSEREQEQQTLSKQLQEENDADTLDQLQWELNSQSREPADGTFSRASMFTPDMLTVDATYQEMEEGLADLSSDQVCDLAMRLSNEDLAADFDDNAAMADEDQVKALH